MNDYIDDELKKVLAIDKKHDNSNHVRILTDIDIPVFSSEQKITMFGHSFTMAELNSISRFSEQLESATNSVIDHYQIMDGAIFIIKIINKETQLSFGGICKK
jgi:hypothetical protein